MTPADLSRPGWELVPGRDGGTVVADGAQVSSAALAAVLVRLPWVTVDDLPRIAADDRGYVAAEMTAVLLAWLSGLRCPVVNRPSTTCLAGPLWRPERWARLAAAVGLPAAPVRRRATCDGARWGPQAPADGALVTVTAERCLGTDDPALEAILRRLAQHAGAAVLSVRLSARSRPARLLSAGPWADLDDDAVLDLVLRAAGLAPDEARAAPLP